MGIIEINNLSKRYLRSKPDSSLSTLGEALVSTLKNPLSVFRRPTAASAEDAYFWALKDINFQVQPGEVVGIIGRNGAGKSTLLKVLSRITEPTTGRLVLRGRMASLLEVGTGFHPELTGRENIYLNGAILGMKKHEIRAKFDEIVDFSEIEQFLDTPVKRYSSGMYVRLAFAVAAHLDPEILIVDEVLAVGDFAFQRKCLGRMSEVSRNGRTILFVSHNMAAVENLCTRGVVLQHGKLIYDGGSSEAIREYLHTQSPGSEDTSEILDLTSLRRGSNHQQMINTMRIVTDDDMPAQRGVRVGASLTMQLSFRLGKPSAVGGGFAIENLFGQRIFLVHTKFAEPLHASRDGEYVLSCRIPSLPLCPGEYRISLGLLLGDKEVDSIEDACRLTVVSSDYYGTGKLPGGNCLVVVPHDWSLETPQVPVTLSAV
jgi:lipopolysaccharide transport system ATP-binding protein